jgi:hypothetical protein
MFGLSYHCGNCDGLASRLNAGRFCPTCGSTSVVPASWYQLSVEERSEWNERIQGRRTEIDRYHLDEPGIRPVVVHPPLMACTGRAARHAIMSPHPEEPAPSPLLGLWVTFCAWLSSLFSQEAPAVAEAAVAAPVGLLPEPMPAARMTGPVRPRMRPTRPVVWSRQHAPRAPVRVERTPARHTPRVSRCGPGPPRRRRLRMA